MKLWTGESKLEDPWTVKSLHKADLTRWKIVSYIRNQSAASSRQYLNKWIFAGKGGKYLLLQSGIENWEFQSHSEVFVTIAVLKLFFTNLYNIMCSYIKKNQTFWGTKSVVVYCSELLKPTRFLVRYFMLIYLRIVKRETALVLPYVVITKKSLDVQLRYHSQFRVWVTLEEHQGFISYQ